ncbi:hypothetical protein ACLKA7_016965 [Drosophila subpalustris]
MALYSLLPLALSGILLLILRGCECRRTWDYELISISTSSSDDSKLAIQSKIERSKYNDLSFTIIIDWKFDMKDDDMIEMEMFRSPSGHEADFKPLPYTIPKIPFSDAKKNYYKQFLYGNIAHCSNIPTYEEIENSPWPKKNHPADNPSGL